MAMINENLKKAVDAKDILAARGFFYTIILSDPAFKTSKFEECFQYVMDRGLEGFLDPHDGEELKPKTEWDEKYFDLLASKLQDNFSMERISQLKKVASELYGDSHISTDPSLTEKLEHQKKTNKSKSLHVNESDDYVWAFALGTVAIVWMLLRHIFKGDK